MRGGDITKDYRTNERIRAREVRLIGESGEQMGVVPLRDAIQLARERGADVVEVAPNVQPPVCRLLDYGKFKYEQAKKDRESRKRQAVVALRQVRVRPRTGQHDIDSKTTIAERLLAKGNKVKVLMIFRGREITHSHLGKEILDGIAEALEEKATVEKPPLKEGNSMTMILAPRPVKPPTKEKAIASEEIIDAQDKDS
ncbi:translation initiation factor IF-3 [Chloroflexota bacterium]